MEVVSKKVKIGQLVSDFREGVLRRPAEYQRGEIWHPQQKQKFIDSLHRGYPVPAVFLHQIAGGEYFDIIDGQQRLAALRDYLAHSDSLRIPEPNEKSKFRLPQGIRDQDVPWFGKIFSELDKELRIEFMNRELEVHYVVNSNANEIRDLFIRLQAGTPLAPQQIRDAWPGNLSPYIERLGGKFNVPPGVPLLNLIDGRGDRTPADDDENAGRRDPNVVKRQVCAQMLSIFLHREGGLGNIPSISSKHLDLFYYVESAFPTEDQEPLAREFEGLLQITGRVVRGALAQLVNRKMLPKIEVFAVFMFLQESKKQHGVEFDPLFLSKLTDFVAQYEDDCVGSRTKSSTISGYYERWLRALVAELDVPETRFIKERDPLLGHPDFDRDG